MLTFDLGAVLILLNTQGLISLLSHKIRIMNYKVYFENNKASRCEHVKDINDMADFAIVGNSRIIKSLVVSALNDKDALLVAERLAEKFSKVQF